MSTVLDLVASEYGWTPAYVLDHLTFPQLESLISAISRRYQRQADAVRSGSRSPADGKTVQFDETKPAEFFAARGVRVKKSG
jgi:hypothetical protein